MPDATFNEKYEKAVESLSNEQLSQVARLSKAKLTEWVNSPEKIRPHLLKRWIDEGTLEYEQNNSIPGIVSDVRISAAKARKQVGATAASVIHDFAEKSRPRIEELKREREERRKNPPPKPTIWDSLWAALTFNLFSTGKRKKRNKN